jgi:uncharacterized protein YjbI with pentapeptide repeats
LPKIISRCVIPAAVVPRMYWQATQNRTRIQEYAMKRYLIALALLAGACSVAQAHCVGCSASGGTVFNGISLNGVQFNNWRLNGLQLNGVQFNGATARGFDAPQTTATDWAAVPLNQVQVRLPAAR